MLQNVSNLKSIVDLKQIYIDNLATKEPVKVTQIRFFCLGKELKDELFVYSYDI